MAQARRWMARARPWVLLVLVLSSTHALADEACKVGSLPGVVWHGTEPRMTLARLAAYVAPVYWFSPDEPRLRVAEGGDIQFPQALPFEAPADRPVVYYQFDELALLGGDAGRASVERAEDPGETVVDLRYVASFQLDFFIYFPDEQGVGAHTHDVETAEFKAIVFFTAHEELQQLTGVR